MKNKFKALSSIFILFMATTIATTANAEELSKANVEALIVKIDAGITAMSIAPVEAALSDDVSITIKLDTPEQKELIKPKKAEYLNMLQRFWSAYDKYKFERTNIVINIKDNKAIATGTLKEYITMHDQDAVSTSQEEAIFQVINGKLVITEISSHTTVK